MKKIAIITMGVALLEEKGYTRFRYLSDFLVKAGYEVDLITSTFQHWEKKQRNLNDYNNLPYEFDVHFIYEPGYKKNVDWRRIYSHRMAAKNIKKFLEEHEDYDLLYTEIPPNDVALEIGKYAKKKSIPFVVDVNDLWPEAMRMVLDVPVISDVLFYKFQHDAEETYKLVSGVIGTSDEYCERPFKFKEMDVPKATVYVGNDLAEFDAGVKELSCDIRKNKNEFWVAYAGTIGTSYDIGNLIDTSSYLQSVGKKNIKFLIMGGGPLKEELENRAKTIDCNVEFIGYVPYKKMAAYLAKSDITVNSFQKKAPQSIVTKIGDYLASGKPMINTCSSEEFKDKVKKDGFGLNVEAENPVALGEAICSILENEKMKEEMGRKARKIAETEFDRKIAYKKIENLISSLLN